jgi:hypothetical protein
MTSTVLMARLFGGAGYATIDVSQGAGPKHTARTVFSGNYDGLPTERRSTAIANAIVHETAVHQFHTTLGNDHDAYFYGREFTLFSSRAEINERYGTVADSYFDDESTHDGPIPIHPDDALTLQQTLGPLQLGPPKYD